MPGIAKHVTDLKWSLASIAHAMGLSEDAVSECLKDGRSAVFFVTRKLDTAIPGHKAISSAQVKHALTDKNGGVWAVKCLTSRGVDFSKSNMRGVGRSFKQVEFDKMLASLAGFFVADIVDFPKVPVWRVDRAAIQTVLKQKNTVGASLSRKEFQDLI